MAPPFAGVAFPALRARHAAAEFVRKDCSLDRAQLQQALEGVRLERVLLATGDTCMVWLSFYRVAVGGPLCGDGVRAFVYRRSHFLMQYIRRVKCTIEAGAARYYNQKKRTN
ncbi:hypothetical protein ATCC90586_008189 [Pythium insidiosum]|nr:hypothetical protein ATCC90586_008189 [Pythium insidiosum]